MEKASKRNRQKATPVIVKPQYTLGLGFNQQNPDQNMETMLGKHQARYMENIFTEMNKFTKTAIMTVVPDVFAQLLNVLKQEKQRLIAEQLDAEAGGDGEKGDGAKVVDMKNPIGAIPPPEVSDAPKDQGDTQEEKLDGGPKEEREPQDKRVMTEEEANAMRENNADIVEDINKENKEK